MSNRPKAHATRDANETKTRELSTFSDSKQAGPLAVRMAPSGKATGDSRLTTHLFANFYSVVDGALSAANPLPPLTHGVLPLRPLNGQVCTATRRAPDARSTGPDCSASTVRTQNLKGMMREDEASVHSVSLAGSGDKNVVDGEGFTGGITRIKMLSRRCGVPCGS